MAISRVKTWSNGEVLTHTDLNAEFDNILNNALSLVSPLTGELAAGGNDITGLDELALNNASANASAAGRLRRNSTRLTWHNGTSAQKVLTEIFPDEAAASTTAGQLQRNGSQLSFHDGVAARNLATVIGGTVYGLTMSNSAGDPTNDIDIATGAAVDSTAARPIYLASALTKQLDATWAVGTNAGGLDTGSIANTTYHVWLIMRSDTGVVDVLFSTSATAPTMPTNYDFRRRIGSIIRESGAIVLFTQTGDYFIRTTPATSVNSSNPGTSAVTATLNTPSGVKYDALIIASLSQTDATVNGMLLTDLSQTDTAPSNQNLQISSNIGGATTTVSNAGLNIYTNTSAQIRYRLVASNANTNVVIITRGWIDRRNRDS